MPSFSFNLSPQPAKRDDASGLIDRANPGLAALVREYLAELPLRIAELQAARTSGDWQDLFRRAHGLKGAAAMYGLAGLRETAGLLEAAIVEGQDSELIEELIVELVHGVEQVRQSAGGAAAGDDLAAGPAKP